MLEVELDVYSGRPNPTWTLNNKEEKELVDRIVANPAEMSPVDSEEYQLGLGYRGLIVRQIKQDEGAWSLTHLSSGTPFPFEFRVGVSVKSDTNTMDWLMKTSEKPKSTVSDFLREIASQGIEVVELPSSVVNENYAEALNDEPKHCSSICLHNNPCFSSIGFVFSNNCYCFASNHLASARFAKPGCRGKRPMKNFSLKEMSAGLTADKWTKSCQASNNLIIAAVVWPDVDFHFYRLISINRDRWAHKPGGLRVSKVDNAGKVISNPKNCARGPYTSFYGYWL